MSGPIPDHRLYAAGEAAAAFFWEDLLGASGAGPRAYLTNRGFAALLSADSRWTVGHAPAGQTQLRDHLRSAGFRDDELEAAGLVLRARRGELIDRFRDRITFGIRDGEGRLCGFTARKPPASPAHVPNYINSPRTQIYAKNEFLFGLGEAHSQFDSVVITEGSLDAIAVELGLTDSSLESSSLALCGCALTIDHARLLKRNGTVGVILALDPDDAGRRALLPASRSLMSQGLRTSIATGRRDPAGTLRHNGLAEVARVIATAQPAVDVILRQLVQAWPTRGMGAEADLCCLRSVARQLVTLPEVDPAALATALAKWIPVGLETVTSELAECWLRRSDHDRAGRALAPGRDPAVPPHRTRPPSPGSHKNPSSLPTLRSAPRWNARTLPRPTRADDG